MKLSPPADATPCPWRGSVGIGIMVAMLKGRLVRLVSGAEDIDGTALYAVAVDDNQEAERLIREARAGPDDMVRMPGPRVPGLTSRTRDQAG